MKLDPEFATAAPFYPEPAPAGFLQRNKQREAEAGKARPPYLAEFLDVLDSICNVQGTRVEYQSTTWWIAYNAFIQGVIDGTKGGR